MIDQRGIQCSRHGKNVYYNKTNAAKYVGMSQAGFDRKIMHLQQWHAITVPIVLLPGTRQGRFIDQRILDIFNTVITVGQEKQWREKLREVIRTVEEEFRSGD